MDVLRSVANLVIGGLNNLGIVSQPVENGITVGSPFIPTYTDICIVRALLKGYGLPTELVLEILDYAQYNPVRKYGSRQRCAAGHGFTDAVNACLCLEADVLGFDIIRELKAVKVKAKVRKIEFECVSCDQGWTSENTDGTFNTSSWLEVSILRPRNGSGTYRFPGFMIHEAWKDPERRDEAFGNNGGQLVPCPVAVQRGAQGGEKPYAWYLQGNRVARPGHYRVVWSTNAEDYEGNEGSGGGEGFLETLREGDIILVWARAKVCCVARLKLHLLENMLIGRQYPGWRCIVNEIEMTVHYAFEE